MGRHHNPHESKTAEPSEAESPEDIGAQSLESDQAEPEAGNAASSNAKPSRTKPSKLPLWDFLEDDTRNADGTHTMVYRLEPVINRRHNEHFIARKNGRLNREDMLAEFGSGVYELWVKDVNKKLLYREQASFHHFDHPPRVDPGEIVVGNPANEVYFKTWAKKSANGDKSDKQTASAGDMNIVDVIRAAREGNKVDPQVISWLQDVANHRDDLATKLAEASAKNPTADLASLISAVKSLMPAQTAADPLSVVDKVLAIQNRSETDIEKVWKLVEKVQGRAEPQPGPMDAMKETLELFTQVKELFKPETTPAAAAAASPDDALWERIAVNLSGQAASLFSVIPAVIAAIKGTPAPALPQSVPGAAGPALTAFDPYRNPDIARAFARAQHAQPPQAGPVQPGAVPPQPGPAEPETATGQPAANGLAEIASLITTALNCLNRGIDGHACAESIAVLNGDLAYESLAGQIKATGVPVVIQLAKAIPEVGAQVAAYEGPLGRFITEFCEGPAWDDEEEAQGKGAAA